MRNIMEEQAKQIILSLRKAGFSAYYVGGYVRDRLLNRAIQDVDIATSALPEQVMEVFPRTVPTGLKHGTVTVLAEGHSFEVTTYRKESEYEGFRRPKQVEYIDDLVEDLRRRDFTMNAMAMDTDGTLIDPFGGQADLADGVLRCVGNPYDRFREDGLRMLRCIRFAAEYHLQIESATWQALLELKPLLKHIAMERVHLELDKLVCGSDPHRGWNLLLDSGMIHCFKSDLQLTSTEEQLLKMSQAIQHITKLPNDSKLRWGLILLELERSPEQSDALLSKLLFSNRLKKKIVNIVKVNAQVSKLDSSLDWRFLALKMGKEAMLDWLVLMAHRLETRKGIDGTGSHLKLENELSALLEQGRNWVKAIPIWELRDLAVTGHEIKQLGARGPLIGEVLERLLNDVVLGLVPNEKNALLQLAEQYLRK